MKLPESKRDQIGLLVLATMGVAAVVAGLIFGVFRPFITRHHTTIQRIAKLQTDVRVARRQVAQMAADSAEASRISEDLWRLNDYILHPRLGNYLLSASDALDAYAKEANIVVESATEGPITILPTPTGMKATRTLKAYTAHVKVRAGLHDLARFFRTMETHNPYACISSIDIAADVKNPEAHSVSFDMQWPIWDDNENTPEVVHQLLASGTADVGVDEHVRLEEDTDESLRPDSLPGDASPPSP